MLLLHWWPQTIILSEISKPSQPHLLEEIGPTTSSGMSPVPLTNWVYLLYIPHYQKHQRVMRWSFWFIDATWEDSPFAAVIKEVKISPQLFKDYECWSGQGLKLGLSTHFVDAQPTESSGCLNVHSSVKTLYNQNKIKYMYFVVYTWRASILVI